MPDQPAANDVEENLPELTPEPLQNDDGLPESISAEQSAALLKTLDELAGSDIRIEDTGVEWRVLDDDELGDSPVDEILGHPVFDVEWDDSLDSVYATSVADNCMDTQHLMNGIYRALVDNLNLSGNSMLAIKEEMLEDNLKETAPGAVARLDPEVEHGAQNHGLAEGAMGGREEHMHEESYLE